MKARYTQPRIDESSGLVQVYCSMEVNRGRNPGKIEMFVGQTLVRECFSCGMAAGRAESAVPSTVMQKWICSSCGTLNQFEIEFRKES